MQYLLTFLGVIIIAFVMNFFMLISIRQLSKKINTQMEGHFIKELSVFDALYDEKNRKLKRLKEEEENLKNNLVKKKDNAPPRIELRSQGSSGVTNFEIPSTETFNKNFYQYYRYLRDNFRVSVEEAIKYVKSLPDERLNLDPKTVLSEISMDTVFSMITLSSDEQLNLLKDDLSSDSQLLLSQYLDENSLDPQFKFDILKFYEYCQNLSEMTGSKLTVFTGDKSFTSTDPDLEVKYDANICEGIRIVKNGQVFDFSI